MVCGADKTHPPCFSIGLALVSRQVDTVGNDFDDPGSKTQVLDFLRLDIRGGVNERGMSAISSLKQSKPGRLYPKIFSSNQRLYQHPLVGSIRKEYPIGCGMPRGNRRVKKGPLRDDEVEFPKYRHADNHSSVSTSKSSR